MQMFTAKQYLMIDIANNFGLEKEDWDIRLSWFEKNESNLMNMIKQAEEPALFYAGVQAWNQVKEGKPIGYPISLDGTSSGLQILACVTGDRKAAQLCNVVNTGHRMDAYQAIYEAMLAHIGQDARVSRDDCKSAIMTALYGSQAVPKEVFGEGALLKTFYQVMQENAPAAWELNEAFLEMWNPENTINSWVMPDNFHVHVKVMDIEAETVFFQNKNYETYRKVNKATPKGRSLGANTTHSIDGMIVREITRRCDHDPEMIRNVNRCLFTVLDTPEVIEDTNDARMVLQLWEHYEKSGYLSARILEHINEETVHLIDDRGVVITLIESLPAKSFKVISIHD